MNFTPYMPYCLAPSGNSLHGFIALLFSAQTPLLFYVGIILAPFFWFVKSFFKFFYNFFVTCYVFELIAEPKNKMFIFTSR